MIIGVSSSPRMGHSTDKAIDDAMDQFQKLGYKTKIIHLRKHALGPCVHCDVCKKENKCIDANANEINDLLADAQAIVCASPVYFASMNAQMKSMIDKTRPLRVDGFKLEGKIGAGISLGASRNGGQEMTLQAIHAWMLFQGMVVAGDRNHLGGTVVGDYAKDKVGQQSVKDTVQTIHRLLTKK